MCGATHQEFESLTLRYMIDLSKIRLKRRLKRTENPFLSLSTSIIYQQISTKAGDSIHKRFLALFGKKKFSPKTFLEISETSLRSAGLSKQKISYLKDLAEKFLDKTIDPTNFDQMSDLEIKEHLVRVRGVGPWTADMFLIFALNRPNILPVGDLGIKNGFKKLFNLKSTPKEVTMRRLSRPFSGQFTKLSLYLWQVLDE